MFQLVCGIEWVRESWPGFRTSGSQSPAMPQGVESAQVLSQERVTI